MIWVILTLLGVPLWLVAGLLLGVLLTRRRITHTPGVFRAKVKLGASGGGRLEQKWSSAHALWIHDVLLLSVVWAEA